MEILYVKFWGNPLYGWMISAALLFGVFGALWLVKYVSAKYLLSLAARKSSSLDQFFGEVLQQRTKSILLAFLAVYIASAPLILPAVAHKVIKNAAVVVLFFQIGLWGNGIIAYWKSRRAIKDQQETSEAAGAYGFISFLAKAGMWVMLTLVVLNNMGVDITALIAGLGVGGVAAALAVQNILGDLFASMSIALDKPFVVGDFIVVDDLMGTVEHIGLKTTRIRSIIGEQIVFSNGDLLKSRVRNFKRMYERRVVFSIGVAYQTPHDAMAEIPRMIKEIVQGVEKTRFDRAHFAKFGESALIFEIAYYIQSADMTAYMDIQQTINLAIMKAFAEKNIVFAYPTQTIYVAKQA